MEPNDYINLCKEKLNGTLRRFKDKNPTPEDIFVMEMLGNIMVLDNPVLNADLIMNQVAESYYPNNTDAAYFITNLYGMRPNFEFLDAYLDIFFERLYEDELNIQVTSAKVEQLKMRLGQIDPKYLDVISKKESQYIQNYK